MNYAYIRVSTDKQTVDNQFFEISQFCQREGIQIDVWIEETISGTSPYSKRKLGGLLRKVRKEDLIVASELSRLGRNLFMIMEILKQCMDRECRVWTVKDGYRLGDDIQSKVLAFAFGLSAEIERNLISQRTREALSRLKNNGVKLGRPPGSRNRAYRIDKHASLIYKLLEKGVSKREIARKCRVSTGTLYNWLRRNGKKE